MKNVLVIAAQVGVFILMLAFGWVLVPFVIAFGVGLFDALPPRPRR